MSAAQRYAIAAYRAVAALPPEPRNDSKPIVDTRA